MLILDPKQGVRFGVCKDLKDFYREIGCDCIDIARRTIGGKQFDIFVDDEGLLKADAGKRISAVAEEDGALKPQLVGTLVFANHDAMGNTTDLSLDDTLLLSSRVNSIRITDTETGEAFDNYCIVLDPVVKYDVHDFTAWLKGGGKS